MKKKVTVVTTSRADFGLLSPIMDEILRSNKLELQVVATGMHLLEEYGNTVQYVEEKFDKVDKVPIFKGKYDRYSLIESIGNGFIEFSKYLKNHSTDLMLVLGDRSELIVPVYSAMLCNIPIAHVFGGDNIDTYVTYDNNIRHAITKLSNLHFAATKDHAIRILKLGEEEWRVKNVGSPALDYIKNCQFVSKEELKNKLKKIDFNKPFALLTYHPVHTEVDNIKNQINNIIGVLNSFNMQVVCTKPNNDIGNEIIMEAVKEENTKNPNFELAESLSQEEYYSLMKYCEFMIGNSSSIVLESASFNKPSISIGSRQKGRIHGDNVIEADYDADNISKAVDKCINDIDFIEKCREVQNPYGDGNASKRIVKAIEECIDDYKKLVVKKITY